VYITNRGTRRSPFSDERPDVKAFIVHIVGNKANIYWAEFSPEYLRIVHKEGITALTDDLCVRLNHTELYNLFNPQERTAFLKHMIALLQYVAEGEASIGHLRLPGEIIHRKLEAPEVQQGMDIPGYLLLDKDEEQPWLKENGILYGP
jgi:hypothetical protein